MSLRWRHNEQDGVLNHQPYHCLLDRLFRRRSQKTSKLRVTGLCVGNSPETGEFPAQMASNAENVSIWWRHHEIDSLDYFFMTTSWHGSTLRINGPLCMGIHQSPVDSPWKDPVFRNYNVSFVVRLHAQAIGQAVELPVIWYDMALTGRHCICNLLVFNRLISFSTM